MKAGTCGIIVVTYNSADEITDCLNSIRQVTAFDRLQLCVIDNASTDGTAERVQAAFPEATLIRNHVNVGFAAANNQAYPLLDTEFIFLINPDATVSPDAFEACLRFMESHPRCGACGGRILNPSGQTEPSARLFPCATGKFMTLSGLSARFRHIRIFGQWDCWHLDMDQDLLVDWVPGTFTCFRKSMLQETGFFDERFYLYYEETDLCLRARKAGWEIWYTPAARVTHIGGASSKKRTDLAFDPGAAQLMQFRMRSELLYFRKNFGLGAVLANMAVEQLWHLLRFLLHCRPGDRHRASRSYSATVMRHGFRAIIDTRLGRTSPPTPW